jgi:hypothetical protein
MEAARPDDQGSAGSASESARSGDFSHDPALDPEQLFQVIGREENAEQVSKAMRAFLSRGDTGAFEQAVAVFVRSARARGEPVERVLAVLIELAEALEGASYPHDRNPTDLRWVVLRGVLLAFYGDTAAAARRPGGDRRRGSDRRHFGAVAPTDD